MLQTWPDRETAEQELQQAGKMNPGKWVGHSLYVAKSAELIAQAAGMDKDRAYVLGLLHDIGRRIGFCGQKHIYAGYLYALEKGWIDVARISLTHSFYFPEKPEWGTSSYDGAPEEWEFIKKYITSFEFDDYDRLIRLADALGCAEGFCIIEKRVVDVALRYGEFPGMIEKWRKMFAEKQYFEKLTGCNLYTLLPGIKDNL